MAETIYTQTLAKAAEIHGGSTQALASFLHVPENTLLRWMSGRAQMPLQAFLKLIEVLTQSERNGAAHLALRETARGEPLTFKMGEVVAHCARCDGSEFAALASNDEIKFTSELACRDCGERVVHGNLICQLAKDAVQHSRAKTAARSRRQVALLKASPKLRALKKTG
jgi:DNA-directed RNA polymerase subunit RPC12/RpoP